MNQGFCCEADLLAVIHVGSSDSIKVPRAAMAEILSCNFIFGFSAA
jgi:hypothetical protein